MLRRLGLSLLWMLAVAAVAGAQEPAAEATPATQVLTLSSAAFKAGEAIPRRYTADGMDVSPPLRWKHVPPGCRSLAVTADDPDAPAGVWVHWVLYNLPPSAAEIPEGVAVEKSLVGGIKQGKNDFGRFGYGGPSPPPGKAHRYFFRLYALDVLLDLSPEATQKQLLEAMEGHILAQAELMGTYQR